MSLEKMGNFAFKHIEQADTPTLTPTQLKTGFDSRGEELKTAVNDLIDALEAVDDGASGADAIGMTPHAATGTSATVQGVVEAHLDNISPHGQASTTYYVDASKAGDTGDGSTPATAFKHLQYAINLLKKNLVGDVVIRVIAGDYSAEGLIVVEGFTGKSALTITAYDGSLEVQSNSEAANYIIDSIIVNGCANTKVTICSLSSNYNGSDRIGFGASMSRWVNFWWCNDTVSPAGSKRSGFVFSVATCGQCYQCIASNKYRALYASYGSNVVSDSWSPGTGNDTGLTTDAATIMKFDNNQPQGSTAESNNTGGSILSNSASTLQVAGAYNSQKIHMANTQITVATAGTPVIQTVTFPVAFNNIPYVLVSIASVGAGSAGYVVLTGENPTATGFTIVANSYLAQTITVTWIAIGN